MMRAVLLALALLFFPMLASAQDRATLVADAIGFQGQSQVLEARGNVEITNGEVRLRAAAVRYDGAGDRLEIEGPLYLVDRDGTLILADFASLSGDLKTGVLQSARLVYAQQLQLAAAEIRRDGRYTQFYKTVASSCEICTENPTPLWEIRARRVVHDAEDRQLYFDEASFRVLGVPVFYSPYLRLPDPSVERATGFLIPELRSNGRIGVGLKLPYFFVLDDHSDLTLTPWLTSKGAATLEGRYRREFRFAEIEVNGALTDDDTNTRDLRGYLFADGSYALPSGFRGVFDLELVSDPGYLPLYGYSDTDRLDSAVTIERAQRDRYIGAEIIHYKSLRDGDDNRTIPTLVGDAVYTRRFNSGTLGGVATISLEASGYYRRADEDLTNTGMARDVMRASAVGNWRRDWLLRNGMIFAAETEIRADIYDVAQDARPQFGDTVEVTPYAALEWRWPMLRVEGAVRHVLEPTAQLVFARDSARDVANEDSLLVEFDEANLFRFSRFPGVDAAERGRRLNLGVTYTRDDPDGWTLGLTVGRVLRDTDLGQFSQSSGLQGKSSDWLIAAQLSLGERFSLINRTIIDDGLSLARNEMRMSWEDEDYSLASTFVWLESDDLEGRPENTSEIMLDGAYRLDNNWTLSGDIRYDFVRDRTSRAGIGVAWENECARVELSVSRRFTTSTIVEPTTDLNLSVQLGGFGSRPDQGRAFTRSCNR